MLSDRARSIAQKYLPHFRKDQNEPFPLLHIGCTVAEAPTVSRSFPDLTLDPAAENADLIVEYALYFDYDIQHLYDLEHAWVAVKDGAVTGCWCSFHGMRLCASGVPDLYSLEDGVPLLYIQPGKHAILPDPRLFGLHTQANTCCRELCGGGLLVPRMFEGRMHTGKAQDEAVRAYIRRHYRFTPSWSFIPEGTPILTDWDDLYEAIPGYVSAQLEKIRADS